MTDASSSDTPLNAPVDGATPMMVQYHAVKSGYLDALLFYRMGDFYELFFDDALKAAAALDIALTKRGKHNGEDIPMCGVPVHSHENHLSRLIRKGFKVAVCEQLEGPAEAKRRGSKSVVKRDVVRLITPGTLTEDTLLDARTNNYLVTLTQVRAESNEMMGLAWIDVSVGELNVEAVNIRGLASVLSRVSPGEIVVADRLADEPEIKAQLEGWKSILTLLPSVRFDSENAKLRLHKLYGVSTLDAFGSFSRAEVAAAGALVDYVDLTQKGKLPRISSLKHQPTGSILDIDAATRRNLELTQTLSHERRGSLLATIDLTVTAAGARALAAQLSAPLTSAKAINERLDGVAFFAAAAATREQVRDILKSCPDLERALSRTALGRGGPRDLAAIRDSLAQAPMLRQAIEHPQASLLPPPLRISQALTNLGDHQDLVAKLRHALAADLPLMARDGGFVAAGFSAELDQLRLMRDDSRRLIAELQATYAEQTGLSALKIRHNNVLGYYIEVNAKNGEKLIEDARTISNEKTKFIHRQTLANVMRFATVELSELEEKISSAADIALVVELQVFADLTAAVIGEAEEISRSSTALADLDVAAANAQLSVERTYCRPVVDESFAFHISGGRHPIVEEALKISGASAFVANDCNLGAKTDKGDGRLWLITGPNMAGKSTFLRQNALIAIMAQAGFYVPAASAHIGVIDKLFSRVGAADDLARGRSTFMVEMIETAAILNQATPRSFVILDEIGRGTATYDGLSIAWASLEHLHDINAARALFATHYHELTALSGRLAELEPHTMKVREWQGSVVFLHEIGPGAADRSYGIHVAQFAGMPAAVIARASEVLDTIEKSGQAGSVKTLATDLPLFAAAERPGSGRMSSSHKPSALDEAMAALRPDELTPREALDTLYHLKALLSAKKNA
ncbi:MAG: DNA mismatch repair protein MutS [Alphaproteobacteria bacterium]|nr:DNA mismatch repair protein MutS [Alphaproteobacteria bacterium]PHY01482.1 MAG: DNA mismatch repair protein MutS [Rhodospirillaceae bacterium]